MVNRYKTIALRTDSEGTRYKATTVYPSVAASEDDIYVIATGGDRYDILAHQFYGDQSLWWIIAAANNSKKSSFNIEPGKQLRIPANKDQILQDFRILNSTR